MKMYAEVEGHLVEAKTGKKVCTLPQFQVARPKIAMLGELAVGATFEHDKVLYRKISHNTQGNIPVLRVGPGRPSKPQLPYWLMVII